MFKNQPKGLIAAAFANMGERFGFYYDGYFGIVSSS